MELVRTITPWSFCLENTFFSGAECFRNQFQILPTSQRFTFTFVRGTEGINLMIGQTVSHYRILESLGEGGMGTVYVAEDTHLGRRVSIKFPVATSNEHTYRARFLREARAVSKLSHPNIASIYDYGETVDGQPFLVMELVNGPTLSDLLLDGQLTIIEAVRIVEAIGKALQEAHRHGIIHRDIKPANVVIGERNEPKVLDFGLAKLITEEAFHPSDPDAQTLLATKTKSGIVVGTPMYLSPEQATGAPVDARSDIFALGALLYECLAGKRAFEGGGVVEIAAQILHKEPPPPSEVNPKVPTELDRVTLKALAKKPEERYQSASEMLDDLSAVRDVLSHDAQRTQRFVADPKTAGSGALRSFSEMLQRPRLSIARLLVAGLVLGLIVGAIWWLFHAKPYKPSPIAQGWYDKGTNAMRDGAFYQASQALEQAVAADNNFALAYARLAEDWIELDYAERAREALLRSSSLVRSSTLQPLDALYLDAVTATATRDFSLAIKSYGEIARRIPDQPYAYVDLGRAYEKNEEMPKAIDNYLEATKRDSQYAPAYLRLGILYGRKQDLDAAYSAFNRAETLYRAGGNFEGLTEVLYQRALLLNRIGQQAESRTQLSKALETARTTNNQYQQIKALLGLSVVSRTEGNTVQAKKYVTEAIDLARLGGLENLTTQGLLDLGNVYYVRDEVEEAEKYFKQALDVAQRHQGRRNEARALLSLGSLFIQKDDPDQGLSFVEQALPFFQQGGYRRETSQALLLIGRTKRLKGDYDGALRAFEPQLKFAEQVGDKPQMAISLGDIGTVLILQERYAEALDHFNKSYAISSASGNQLNIGFDLTLRGDALWRLGQYMEAEADLSKATSIADRPDEPNKQLASRIQLINGKMALSRRQFAAAITSSQRAIALDDSPTKHTAIEAKCVLGLAQALSGAKAKGKQSCTEAVGMASQASDPKLLSQALLALAETLLEDGDSQGALTNGLRAQERFAGASQKESEWHSCLVVGLASQQLNNLDTALSQVSRAGKLMSDLQERLGTDHLNSYLSRPDVQFYRNQFDTKLLTTK